MLVVDCGRLSRSIAAIVHGYRTFDPAVNVAGVILNRVASDRHLEILKTALESIEIPILGVVRRQDEIAIPDRHLGLIPTEELLEVGEVIDRLAEVARSGFDWGRLLPMIGGVVRGSGRREISRLVTGGWVGLDSGWGGSRSGVQFLLCG
ncbi:MAG: hypothetical protein HC895_04475 [Leptolyngbyaceae cyanobacterium SM1_3_5]|nr:hypothetical protein [Leptolyngbyaceae cyanobacterium SM1_3_5]